MELQRKIKTANFLGPNIVHLKSRCLLKKKLFLFIWILEKVQESNTYSGLNLLKFLHFSVPVLLLCSTHRKVFTQ